MASFRCLGCMNVFDDSLGNVCPHCGYEKGTKAKEMYHLEPGSELKGRYIVGKVLGAGGFGITYIAWDNVLQQVVAIKEYLPSEFATRVVGSTEVCAYDGEKTYQFEAGLKSFVEEALRLVKFNSLEGIVHVFDSFVFNNTAYIIMEYINGETLMSKLKKDGPMPYEKVVETVIPVLKSLEHIHQDGIIHRDIAPDNIMITDDGRVKLIDFGAARNATTVHSKSLSVLIKPGYAPEEQYRSMGEQGPWTDVYAMAATMYHAITGKLPDEALERKVNDQLKTPTDIGWPIPENLENAIMNALNVKAEYRIQSAIEFAQALEGTIQVERVVQVQDTSFIVKWPLKLKIAVASFVVVALVAVGAILLSSTGIMSVKLVNKEMVNITGFTETEATKELDEIGMKYYIIGRVESDKPNGVILYQEIQPGSKIATDVAIVNVKISSGKTQKGIMPSLKGLTQEEAIKTLEEMSEGYNIIYEFKEVETDKFKEGLVAKQSVKAGKEFEDINKEIVIYIAKNVEETSSTTRATTVATETEKTTEKTTKATTKVELEEEYIEPKTTKAPTTTKAPETIKEPKRYPPNVSNKSIKSAISALEGAGFSNYDYSGSGDWVNSYYYDPSTGRVTLFLIEQENS